MPAETDMPSASLQSRIKAFEALADQRPPSSHTVTSAHVFSLKPPQVKYPPSFTNLLESPISPISDSFYPIAPFTYPKSSSRSPSPSPPNLGRKTSLIDLKDWVVDDGPNKGPSAVPSHILFGNGKHLIGTRELSKTPPPIANKPAAARSAPISSVPLINLESPPKSRPPLPPRKLSCVSTDSSISTSSISDSSATLRLPGPSDSLTVEHTYPPHLPHAFGSVTIRHAPASSISSFHSVSLSSDGNELKPTSPRLSTWSSPRTVGGDDDGSVDGDGVSIADSYENVSVTSAISPTTTVPFDWEKALIKAGGKPRPEPPKLPQRPSVKLPLPTSVSRSVSTSSSSTTTTRRPAPPPPPPPAASHQSLSRTKLPSSRTSLASTSASTSDRSSILSDATTTSRTSISTRNSGQLAHKESLLLRPTPVPPAARSRYENLFATIVVNRRKAVKAARKAKLKSPPSSPVKKSRKAAGWRGLSVDLITNPEDHPILSLKEADSDDDDDAEQLPVGPEERLGGRIVRLVWNASKLDRQKLRDIWYVSQCFNAPTILFFLH